MVWYNWWSFSLGCATKWLVISHPIGLPHESPHLTSAFLHLIQFVQAWWRFFGWFSTTEFHGCLLGMFKHRSKKIYETTLIKKKNVFLATAVGAWKTQVPNALGVSAQPRFWPATNGAVFYYRSRSRPGKTKKVLIGKRFGMGIFSTSWISCDINDMNHRIDELSKAEKAWDQWSKNISIRTSATKIIYIYMFIRSRKCDFISYERMQQHRGLSIAIPNWIHTSSYKQVPKLLPSLSSSRMYVAKGQTLTNITHWCFKNLAQIIWISWIHLKQCISIPSSKILVAFSAMPRVKAHSLHAVV